MKTNLILAALLAATPLRAKPDGGPRGGRLLENEAPRAEFLVSEARRIEIRFYDAALAPVAPAGQVVNASAEAPAGKTRLEFAREGDALVSTTALPEGDGYTVVLQLRARADAKPQNFRIPLHLETCGGCDRAEYACTCEHGPDEHGHEH